MSSIHLFQIHYDAASRNALDPGFTPLDNSDNLRPDWFEFWPIKKYLENTPLDDDAWYGFFSPRFGQKTGISSAQLRNTMIHVATHASHSNVALIQHFPTITMYFLNAFEHGELDHPGLAAATQGLLNEVGWAGNVYGMVHHTGNMTFSNYVVAKPVYWRKWLELAGALFDIVESGKSPLSRALGGMTHYLPAQNHQAPMKTFVQERLVGVILQDSELFKVASLGDGNPDIERILLFQDRSSALAPLQVCNQLKRSYTASGKAETLLAYWQVRDLIRTEPRLAPALARLSAQFHP